MTTNDHYDDILSLRALRSHTDEPVPDAMIERLLEAARWTGSSKNLPKWSFIAVGYPTDDPAPWKFGGRKPLDEVAFRNLHGESW